MKNYFFLITFMLLILSCKNDTEDTDDCSDFNTEFSLIDTDQDGLTDCEETTGVDNPNTDAIPNGTSDPNVADQAFNVKFKFTFNWDGEPINLSDFNDLKYTNENGELLSITRMRYLLSNISLVDKNDVETVLINYNLTDLTNQLDLDITSDVSLNEIFYKKLKFTVGFNEEDNTTQAYADLNVVNWNWPNGLGGGYHIMQYEGRYIDSDNNEDIYKLHLGRRKVSDNVYEANHFNIISEFGSDVLINSDSEIEIKMNIAEWFKNPNLWDLNVFNAPLMPVYEAQVMMHENGASVFSIAIN